MSTVWVLVIVLTRATSYGYPVAGVTIEHATKESCIAAVAPVRKMPGTYTAYCVPADRRAG